MVKAPDEFGRLGRGGGGGEGGDLKTEKELKGIGKS